MFAFGFALVPLYDVFCRYTGINGKTENVAATAAQRVDGARDITVEFLANADASVLWTFSPEVARIVLHPGEVKTIHYTVENLTADALIARAVPSVSPGEVARYFKKMECFCFTEQSLAAKQKKSMAVQFYIDPEMPEKYTTITLSYRLYKSVEQVTSR